MCTLNITKLNSNPSNLKNLLIDLSEMIRSCYSKTESIDPDYLEFSEYSSDGSRLWNNYGFLYSSPDVCFRLNAFSITQVANSKIEKTSLSIEFTNIKPIETLEFHFHPDNSKIDFHKHFHIHHYSIVKDQTNRRRAKKKISVKISGKIELLIARFLSLRLSKLYELDEESLSVFASNVSLKRESDVIAGGCISNLSHNDKLLDFVHESYYELLIRA